MKIQGKFINIPVFLIIIGLFIPSAPIHAQNGNSNDSLVKLLPLKYGIKKADILNSIAFNLASQYPDSAKNYATEAMVIATEAEDEEQIMKLLHTFGVIARFTGNYEETLSLEDSVLASAAQWPEIMASAYQNRGVAYRNLGRPQEALADFQKSLNLFVKLGDIAKQSNALNSIGVLYMYRDNHEDALEYFTRAMELCATINDHGQYADILNNIAIIYSRSGRFDSAMTFFEKSLAVEKKRGNLRGQSEGYTNIGSLYYLMGNLSAAIENFKISQEIDSASQNIAGQMINLNNIAQVYSESGEPQKAVTYLHRALAKGKQLKALYELETTYLNFSDAYETMAQYDSALYYYTQYSSVHDSLLNEMSINKIAKLETQFKTREKEQELKIQRLTIGEQESALLKRDTLITVLLLVILVIIIATYLLYQRYRHRKELELQQSIIKEQQRGLEAVFSAQEEERQRISKDLHDGIGQQLSALKLILNRLIEYSADMPEERKNLLERIRKILDDTAGDVRTLSHQMMPRALSEMGLEAALRDMLHSTLDPANIKYTFDTYGLTQRLNQTLEISLYRICQELSTNIIKHSGATQVSVQLLQNNGYAILIVEDNGSGISQKNTGSGIGLLNIRNRINTLNGEINYEPSPGSGLLTTIRIPIGRSAKS